jgi:c-di-GMP-binding flagellar brake protein YcgR
VSEKSGGFDGYLKPGLIVSLQAKSQPEVAAVVSSVTKDLISVNPITHGSELTFQEGEQLRIKNWDQETAVYYWTADIIKILSEQNLVTLSAQTYGKTQRRASYRVTSPVRFSSTVIEATDTEFTGKRIADHNSKNLSVNGVLFETDLPLKVGDRMGLDFHLPHTVNATGWVVRSDGNGIGGHSVAVMFLQMEEEQRPLIELLSLLG